MNSSKVRAELKVGQEIWLRGEILEIVEPNHRGIGVKIFPTKSGRFELPVWVDADALAVVLPAAQPLATLGPEREEYKPDGSPAYGPYPTEQYEAAVKRQSEVLHALQEVKTCAEISRGGWLISNRVMKVVEAALAKPTKLRTCWYGNNQHCPYNEGAASGAQPTYQDGINEGLKMAATYVRDHDNLGNVAYKEILMLSSDAASTGPAKGLSEAAKLWHKTAFEFLGMHTTQRMYGWHEVEDALTEATKSLGR